MSAFTTCMLTNACRAWLQATACQQHSPGSMRVGRTDHTRPCTCMLSLVPWLMLLSYAFQGAKAQNQVEPTLYQEHLAVTCLHLGFPCNFSNPAAATLFSYERTQELVTGMVKELHSKQLSWAVGWDDLTDKLTGSKPPQIQASKTAGPHLLQLVDAINSVYNSSSRTTYDDIMQGRPTSMKVVAGWWSREAAPQMKASVVSFGSLERLGQVRAQCMAWPGPLSVAIYQPLLQPEAGPLSDHNREMLRLAVLRVVHLAAEMERNPGACQLSLLLLYELLAEPQAVPMYPLNVLRNIARLQARTPIVVLLDVDLLPSKSLYNRLANVKQAMQLTDKMHKEKQVYIIPAFELMSDFDTLAWADALAAAPNVTVLHHLLSIPVVQQFHIKRFSTGHKLTDYKQWAANGGKDYKVKYINRCEPWLAVPARTIPWSDERYRGYGHDKIQLVNNIHFSGFKFMVFHDAYAIHRPHAKAAAMMRTTMKVKTQAGTASFQRVIHQMYSAQHTSLKNKQPWKPVVGAHIVSCLSNLSWWQGAPNAALFSAEAAQD